MSLADACTHPFSNGTEGIAWQSAWCEHCAHDHEMHGVMQGSDLDAQVHQVRPVRHDDDCVEDDPGRHRREGLGMTPDPTLTIIWAAIIAFGVKSQLYFRFTKAS